jgi:hypothetical protein
MSPIERGCQEKILSLPLRERRVMLSLASSPISVLERLWAGRACIPDSPSSWQVVLDGFMTSWSFDAFGSGSFASKRVGFSEPTMVLCETRGLQLFWVMRGGIRCIWRLSAERLHAGPSSLMDTLPRPRASQEPISCHRVSKPGPAWFLETLKLLAISDVLRRNFLLSSKVSR